MCSFLLYILINFNNVITIKLTEKLCNRNIVDLFINFIDTLINTNSSTYKELYWYILKHKLLLVL